MSYDIYLKIDTGNHMTSVVDVGNMTSNLSPMWGKAMALTSEFDGGLNSLDDKIAGDCVQALRVAIAHMEDNRPEYELLNPSNGWGNYDAALSYLQDILRACIDHPKCTIHVSA